MDNSQLVPPENLTWDNNDPLEGNVTHYQYIIKHYTNLHGPHLDHHLVSNQY